MADGKLIFDTKIDESGFNKGAKSIENTASSTTAKIQAILDDSTRSAKSKAAGIAGVYRSEGMNAQEAFQKAWSHIERGSAEASDEVADNSRKAGKKIKKHAKDASTDVKESYQNALSQLSGIFKKFAIATGAVLSVRGIINFGKTSIEAAASVKAANSQLAQTFGELKSQAEGTMKSVADASGIVQTRLQGVGTSIYAFAKTSGMDSATALTMMQKALQVTADSAAYYDRSLEDTAESLKSFLKGNFENDAALGLSATETTRNTAANKLYGKSFRELSEAQKQLTLLQMVKDANALSGAEGQAAREADGWENVIGNLKETWKQFQAVLGQPALIVATNVVKSMTVALQELTGVASVAINELAGIFGWDISTAEGAETLAESTESAARSYGDMAQSAESANEANQSSLASFDKVSKLGDSSASGGSSAGYTNGQAVTPSINTSSATKESSNFVASLKDIFGKFKSYYEKNFSDIFDGIFTGLVSEFKELGDTFRGIGADFVALGQPLKDYFANDFTPFLQTYITYIGTLATGLFDSFNKVFSDIWNLAVYSCLQSFITLGLPTITQFFTDGTALFTTFFVEVKSLFDSLWTDTAQPIFGFISKAWQDLLTSLSDFWATWGKPIFDGISDAIKNTKDTLLTAWTDVIKPCFDELVSAVDRIWEKHLKPLVDKFLNFVGELTTMALDIYNKFILPVVTWLIAKLGPAFKIVFTAVSNVVETVVSNVIDVVGGIIDILKDIIHFVKAVFKGDWRTAWQSIKDIFSTIWDTMVTVVKTPINLIIGAINKMTGAVESAINWVIEGINELSFDVPDWVPGIGGETFGFDIDNISIPEIPKLAQGAVIPPNSEFLAVLGDQKRGTNIEAPLATIEQALLNVLSKFKGNGGERISLTLPIYLNTRRGLRLLSTEIIDDINSIIAGTGEVPINI